MRALVMAAGLGTRLRPLTLKTPKPLVPVLGKPMIEYALEGLARSGVTEAVVNVHHIPEKMHAFIREWNRRGVEPYLKEQDEAKEILGSGGALVRAAPWLFKEHRAALVCNSDVIGTPNFEHLALQHQKLYEKHGVLCTLAVMRHAEAGAKYTGLRLQGDRVMAFERPVRPDPELWHFPGYYVIEEEAVARLPPDGSPFSIVEKLWKPLAMELRLGAWEYKGPYFDLGTVEDLKLAESRLSGKKP